MKSVSKIDRVYVHMVATQLNALDEITKKVPLDNIIGNPRSIEKIAKPVVQRINSLPEDVFNQMYAEGKLGGEIQELYLVLTGQAEPKEYMLDPKFKGQATEKAVHRPGIKKTEPKTEPKQEKVRKPRTKKEKTAKVKQKKVVKPVAGTMALDKFGFKVNTTTSRIAELASLNRFTVKDISERTDTSLPMVYGIIHRIKKNKGFEVFYETRNQRSVVNVRVI